MAKTQKELNTLKEEYEALTNKLLCNDECQVVNVIL